MAHTTESDQTFSAVSIISIIVKIGRMIPIMPRGTPKEDIRDNVRK